jgi:hypothetical protein
MPVSNRRLHALVALLKRIDPLTSLFVDVDFGPSVPGSIRGPARRVIADARRLVAPITALPKVPARRAATIDLVLPLLVATEAITRAQKRYIRRRRERGMETYPRRFEDE